MCDVELILEMEVPFLWYNTNYTVAHVPEERNPQQYRCENHRTRKCGHKYRIWTRQLWSVARYYSGDSEKTSGRSIMPAFRRSLLPQSSKYFKKT